MRRPLEQLYYITHANNLPSILREGILSHALIEERGLPHEAIYDPGIVERRLAREVPGAGGRTLGGFANLYLQPRNAMLYRVCREISPPEAVVVIAVRRDILNREDVYVTTGNAASAETEFLAGGEGRKAIPRLVKEIDREYWKEEDGTKRKMMAECLVPDVIPLIYI